MCSSDLQSPASSARGIAEGKTAPVLRALAIGKAVRETAAVLAKLKIGPAPAVWGAVLVRKTGLLAEADRTGRPQATRETGIVR